MIIPNRLATKEWMNYPWMKLVRTGRRSEENNNENLSSKLSSSTKLKKNSSFYVIESTRTAAECRQGLNARAKRAKLLFFIVKYAVLRRSCSLRRYAFCGKISVLHVRHALLHNNMKFPAYWRFNGNTKYLLIQRRVHQFSCTITL